MDIETWNAIWSKTPLIILRLHCKFVLHKNLFQNINNCAKKPAFCVCVLSQLFPKIRCSSLFLDLVNSNPIFSMIDTFNADLKRSFTLSIGIIKMTFSFLKMLRFLLILDQFCPQFFFPFPYVTDAISETIVDFLLDLSY